jgi:4-hydroxythreonine-4-phosphate dehydrogenase
MSFWSKPLKVALFTHHLPLHQVPPLITKENLMNFFQTLHQAVNKTNFSITKYLVAGLNPHAGEQGLLGQEETTELIPAIHAARAAGLPLEGPFPPDTLFQQALNQDKTMVIALYHDQGLIAFKLIAFTEGVNITLGLPFIRTSPDHGTAFDIAGQGQADPTSMKEAIKWAYRLLPKKPENAP